MRNLRRTAMRLSGDLREKKGEIIKNIQQQVFGM
jgi:hypothetical protein